LKLLDNEGTMLSRKQQPGTETCNNLSRRPFFGLVSVSRLACASLILILFVGSTGSFVFSNYKVHAQYDGDGDGVDDASDPCIDPNDLLNLCASTNQQFSGRQQQETEGGMTTSGSEEAAVYTSSEEAAVCTGDEQYETNTGGEQVSTPEEVVPPENTATEQGAGGGVSAMEICGDGIDNDGDQAMDDLDLEGCVPAEGEVLGVEGATEPSPTPDATPTPTPGIGTTNQPTHVMPAEYQRILDKLDQLASVADNDGVVVFGSPNFDDAVRGFRNDLESQLKTIDLSRPIPPSPLAITVEALKLWVDDDGKTWGTSDDTADFDSSAQCYAAVAGDENKCNIYVAETIYRATGITHPAHEQTDIECNAVDNVAAVGCIDYGTGKYFPFRAAELATPSTQIPNFQVTSDPKMGDIWAIKYPRGWYDPRADSGHAGIYLGEYYGVKIYVSARSEPDGVYGIDSIQYEDGLQVKELAPSDGEPKGGTYRHYSP
jgi:hypothetical protein